MGVWLGRPDMRWTEQRVLREYQGREFHDSDEQRAQDEVRFTGVLRPRLDRRAVWNDDVNTDQSRVELVLQVADELGHPRHPSI